MTSSNPLAAFRRIVWVHYKKHGRHALPWRKTRDPYKILVSEMMLQQTQVYRVVPFYRTFLRRFPTVRALAKAPLADVLKTWSGLGYNRRAKYLHECAKKLSLSHIHSSYPIVLDECTGIGPYMRAAIRAFAFNEHAVMIETNIRTALMHHFFPHTPKMSDRTLSACAAEAAEGQDPRLWHWALMDYGAHLKATGVRNNHRSAHYARQSRFDGSLRQIRGAILRSLNVSPRAEGALRIEMRSPLLRQALAGLKRDGLIRKGKGKWRIA